MLMEFDILSVAERKMVDAFLKRLYTILPGEYYGYLFENRKIFDNGTFTLCSWRECTCGAEGAHTGFEECNDDCDRENPNFRWKNIIINWDYEDYDDFLLDVDDDSFDPSDGLPEGLLDRMIHECLASINNPNSDQEA